MGLHGSARRGSAVLASALGLAFAPSAAHAEQPAELDVDCPVLSGELRSSLEARSRAELAMKRLANGRLLVRCAASRVVVEFVRANGPSERRDASLTGEPKAFVEQILALVHEVTRPSDAPSAGAQVVLRERSAAAEEPPTAPTATSEPPPPSFPPRRLAPAPAQPAPIPATSTALQLDPGIGACAELWTNQPLVLFGPCLSFGFRLRSAWRIAPALAAAWGSAEPSGIAVRSLQGGIEASFGERLWLGFAAHLSWLHFAPGAELSPSAQTALEPELALRVGYSFVGRRQSLATALGLRTYPEYRDVRINGAAAFRVPALAIVASLEYRFGLRD